MQLPDDWVLGDDTVQKERRICFPKELEYPVELFGNTLVCLTGQVFIAVPLPLRLLVFPFTGVYTDVCQ